MRHATSIRLIFIIASMGLAACHSSIFGPGQDNSHFGKAERLRSKGEYDRAIIEYQNQIIERNQDKQRPDWENPNFYLLFIGDVELQRGNPDKALEIYEQAETLQVDKALVTDRYRSVGSWYEQQKDLQKSYQVIKKYRDRDPLLFDGILDRLAKEM